MLCRITAKGGQRTAKFLNIKSGQKLCRNRAVSVAQDQLQSTSSSVQDYETVEVTTSSSAEEYEMESTHQSLDTCLVVRKGLGKGTKKNMEEVKW